MSSSTSPPVLRTQSDVTPEWLSLALGQAVRTIDILTEESSWSSQLRLKVQLADGSERSLRLKLCLGLGFGPSEVHYYTRDYVDLADAPLVRCYHAAFEAEVGYHVLMDDLTATHRNRRGVKPTRDFALSLASAMARLHRHHLHSQPPAGDLAWNRYLAEIRPGVEAMEQTIGRSLPPDFERHADRLRSRWANPLGQTLLHGDCNTMNILTRKDQDSPVLFLDRQPFDWSLTYGLALYDLAYATAIWWPPEQFRDYQAEMLLHWYDTLQLPEYSWPQAQLDWKLSIEHCFHVPLEWCSKPETLHEMRSLWEWQLANLEAALACLK